jgi:ubiquinone/menaquinone biosynthesis C-methylase UbiE
VAEIIPSPNIWQDPEIYELENRGVDPDGLIEAAIRRIRAWTHAHVLDLGCGTGFHLPRFAAEAARVTGIEPHPPLIRLARQRVEGLRTAAGAAVQLRRGRAQALPVPDASVDLAHARWSYFFGPGCEPGLAELARVIRRGGVAVVIDNDATRSTFGGWFRRGLPEYDPAEVERFWSSQGFHREPLEIRWQHPDRRTFEAVVRIEFAPELAEELLAEHPDTSVDYAVNLFWREY